MPIPGFTLDIGSLLTGLIIFIIGFLWKHLETRTQEGDRRVHEHVNAVEKSLSERIQHVEKTTGELRELNTKLLDHIQRIENTLTVLNTRFDIYIAEAQNKSKNRSSR